MKRIENAITNMLMWSFALGLLGGYILGGPIAQSGTGIAVEIVLGVAILSFFVLRYRDIRRALDGIREVVSDESTTDQPHGA